jgi:hypothetical protein
MLPMAMCGVFAWARQNWNAMRDGYADAHSDANGGEARGSAHGYFRQRQSSRVGSATLKKESKAVVTTRFTLSLMA